MDSCFLVRDTELVPLTLRHCLYGYGIQISCIRFKSLWALSTGEYVRYALPAPFSMMPNIAIHTVHHTKYSMLVFQSSYQVYSQISRIALKIVNVLSLKRMSAPTPSGIKA